MKVRVPNLVALVRFFKWLWDGRLCSDCKVYRTGSRIFDVKCDVCEIIESLKKVEREIIH